MPHTPKGDVDFLVTESTAHVHGASVYALSSQDGGEVSEKTTN